MSEQFSFNGSVIAAASTQISSSSGSKSFNNPQIQNFLSKLDEKADISSLDLPSLVGQLSALHDLCLVSEEHKAAAEEIVKTQQFLTSYLQNLVLNLGKLCDVFHGLCQLSTDKAVKPKSEELVLMKTQLLNGLNVKIPEPPAPEAKKTPRSDTDKPVLNYKEMKEPELKRLSDTGNVDAQFEYAMRLRTGENGVLRNLKESVRYMKSSADGGNSDAQYEYGYLLFHGKGVSLDIEDATRYFKMSAEQNNPNGQYRYGYSLYSGKGCPKDFPKAAQYLQAAADQGIVGAQYFYGYFLMRGLGIPKNLVDAKTYLTKAADEGDKRARDALKELSSYR